MRAPDALESLNITVHDAKEGVRSGNIFVLGLDAEFPSLARFCGLR